MNVRMLCLAAACVLVSCSTDSTRSSNWWNAAWRYRAGIEIAAGPYQRSGKPTELQLNFSSLLERLGIEGELDAANIRLVETGPDGGILDPDVSFQFDPDNNFDASSNASGHLLFICTDATDSLATRTYDLYFDTADNSEGKIPAKVDTLVRVEDVELHEGQPSFRIQTPAATYYYHKAGAGFASIEDRDGVDWLGYRPCCESDGQYRGIPNMWKFHPGQDSSASRIEIAGPLRTRIHSVAADSSQECVWDIFPEYARMNLLKVDSTYWFLYEGIPGGSLEVERDYSMISSGLRRSIAEDWHGDLPGPEWIYFGDDSIRRTLYLVHHDDDDRTDQFWQMRKEMVVFGFGREYRCCGTYMDRVPALFTVGFAEDSAYAAVSRVIDNAFRPLDVTLGEIEKLRE
ncbi:hypothetical protein ACFL4X_01830 [Gemmatimonadota bacterium]